MAGVSYRKEWSESGVIDKLLTELNAGTELSSGGGITFTATDYRDLFFLLADGITYPDTITRNDASAISYRSFLDLRKKGNVSKKPLISEISKRVVELLSAPRHKYTMWTKCRLRQMSFAPTVRFKIDEVSLRTSSRLPKWLQLNEHLISGIGRIEPNVLPLFGYLIFSVEARNENEASKKIFAAADLFFSIANTSRRSIERWTQRVPSAMLWLGPHQFFFKNGQFIGKDRVWYNQNYVEKAWNRFPKSAEDFNKQANLIRRRIKALCEHPLREPLKASLLLINEGMTSDDLAFRLMRFWSAAEALYAPEEDKTPSKKLISRLTFASKSEEWLDNIKLERCYHLRNMYVHRGANDSDDTSLVQHLRELLLQQVYYYLLHGQDIASHSDLLMMVDLPTEENALERRRLAIDRRLNIARSGRHRP
jgi:hypothetical protein